MDLASVLMGEEGLAKLLLTTAVFSISRPSLKPPAHNTPPHPQREERKAIISDPDVKTACERPHPPVAALFSSLP